MSPPAAGLGVPSLAETLRAQEDLATLCRDRKLVTRELCGDNAFYGGDRILKRYAGLSLDRPLKAVIPHGPVLDPGFVWNAERDAPVPTILCYPPYRQRVYERATRKRVVASTAPYVYVVRSFDEVPAEPRRGTLFFPSHSTHLNTATADFERIATALEQLDDAFLPITVCVYWRDFELGHHEPFARRGFPLVSAGHIFDPDFLVRLHHLCRRHVYAAGNQFGSHAFYAIASGCRYFSVWTGDGGPTHPIHVRAGEPLATWVEPDPAVGPLFDRLVASMGGPEPGDPIIQRELAAFMLGEHVVRTPEDLRSQLQAAERRDLFGYRLRGEASRRTYVAPPRLQRARAKVALRTRVRAVLRRGGRG